MFHFLVRYHMACPGIRKTTIHHTLKRKLAQDFLVCRILRLRLDEFFVLHCCHSFLSLQRLELRSDGNTWGLTKGIPVLASPLSVAERLPVVSRCRPLHELFTLAKPATGLAAPGDLLTFAESARLLIADTSSIGASMHKQIVGAPYTQRTLSFNNRSAHRYPYLTWPPGSE